MVFLRQKYEEKLAVRDKGTTLLSTTVQTENTALFTAKHSYHQQNTVVTSKTRCNQQHIVVTFSRTWLSLAGSDFHQQTLNAIGRTWLLPAEHSCHWQNTDATTRTLLPPAEHYFHH
jgi:hypothetical protein